MVVPAVFLVLIFVIVPAAITIRLFVKLYKDRFNDKPEYDTLLKTHFPAYKNLPLAMQARFRGRLARFMNFHEFEGRQGFAVTPECRILISAAAVHLTLGLNDYMLNRFKKILVYPDIYYSKFSRSFNKGETNPHGIVAFSWPDVVKGFESVKDHINLAYHEFAHALILQEVNHHVADSSFRAGYASFCYDLKYRKLSQRVDELQILRDYAFANKMEFFAVSAEYFMEAPHELHVKCPDLYESISCMLRQDPVNNDYGFHFVFDEAYYDNYA